MSLFWSEVSTVSLPTVFEHRPVSLRKNGYCLIVRVSLFYPMSAILGRPLGSHWYLKTVLLDHILINIVFGWTLTSSMALLQSLKRYSICLFDKKPIGLHQPIFGPYLGLPSMVWVSESQIGGSLNLNIFFGSKVEHS